MSSKNVMKTFAIVGCFVCIIAFPLVIKQQYIIHVVILSSITAILAVSWNLLSGYLGVFSFGHPAFYGIGAYVSALCSIHFDISPWVTIFIGGISASLFSTIVVLPVLRLKGAYVAVVTLSFMIILDRICYNWESLTRGPMGLFGIPSLTSFEAFGIRLDFEGISRVPYYYVAIGMLIFTVLMCRWVVRSRMGLRLMAIRESEEAAAAMGVRIYRQKVFIFIFTSFFAGLGGALYAHYILLLTPAVFAFFVMAMILSATLIGGWGTLYGPILGAFLLGFLSDALKDVGDIHQFFYGAFLIVMIIFLPKGLIACVGDTVRKWVKRK